MIEATMKEKVKEFIVKNFKWIILFICLIGFLAIAENVFNKEIMNGDIVGYKLISTFLISDFATPIAKFITNFGDAIFLTVLTIILFILIKNKKIGLSIFSNLVIITALNQLLKNILQRPRPTEYRIIEETGYSFPSGHSMISMAFYGYIIYLIYKSSGLFRSFFIFTGNGAGVQPPPLRRAEKTFRIAVCACGRRTRLGAHCA